MIMLLPSNPLAEPRQIKKMMYAKSTWLFHIFVNDARRGGGGETLVGVKGRG